MKYTLSLDLPYWRENYDRSDIRRYHEFAVTNGRCGCCAESVELTRDEAYDYCQKIIAAAQKRQAEILALPEDSH